MSKSKLDAFNRVIEWLRDEGFPKVNVGGNSEEASKLYARVFPLIDEPLFFYVNFRRKSSDSFIIDTNIDFQNRTRGPLQLLEHKHKKPSLYGYSEISVSYRDKLRHQISENKSS